ncbi:MAG: helix-turn-helix transcriptional regulator [Bacteroidales bacterium]|nr:helix-turn-helix transcriptional regulator [Bacteroidales bacterium]
MNKLKELRLESILSLRELSKLVAHTVISEVENGKRKMNVGHAKALAPIFKVSEAYLMGDDAIKLDMSVLEYLKGAVDKAMQGKLDEHTRLTLVIKDLQDLTGQESGIVIYPEGLAIICNWSSICGFPKITPYGNLLGLGEEIPCVKGKHLSEDKLKEFLAENVDEYENFSSDENVLDEISGGTIYQFENCIVIAPDNWI